MALYLPQCIPYLNICIPESAQVVCFGTLLATGRLWIVRTIMANSFHAMSINSLHAEVIYMFQFSNAEIACDHRCHSESRKLTRVLANPEPLSGA